MDDALPFAGLKVVDLSQGVAGPYAAMLLARFGAQVIKVEPPEGDWSRTLGTRHGDQSAYSLLCNIGKRGVVLDLKGAAGRDALWRLVAGADVFVQGFRPGVIDRLGFGYEAVAARVPAIVYLSVSGFGAVGPLAERPAMDPVLQAYSGLAMDNVGGDGVPHRVPIVAIDMSTAIYSYGAVAAALYARLATGRGRHIEASLLQAVAGIQGIRMAGTHLDGGVPRPVAPPSGIWRTADGWFSVTVVRPWEWAAFCRALGQTALGEDPRYASVALRLEHAAELRGLLAAEFTAVTNAALAARCAAERVMHEEVNDYAAFLASPQVAAVGAVSWLEHPGVAGKLPLPNVIGAPAFAAGMHAPALGADTRAVLAEHGCTAAEIDAALDGATVRAG